MLQRLDLRKKKKKNKAQKHEEEEEEEEEEGRLIRRENEVLYLIVEDVIRVGEVSVGVESHDGVCGCLFLFEFRCFYWWRVRL